MKRMFSREFLIYTKQNKFVVFNYDTAKGRKNRGTEYMCMKIFNPTPSSWNRVVRLLWSNNYPSNMAIGEDGEKRFSYYGGESLS